MKRKRKYRPPAKKTLHNPSAAPAVVVAEPETSLRFVHNGRTDENITSPHTQPGPPRTGTVVRGRQADLETENNVNASMESYPDVLGKMIATIIREISKDSGGIGNLSRSLVANSVTNGHMGQSNVSQTRRHQNPELKAALEVLKKTMKLDAAAPFNLPDDPVAESSNLRHNKQQTCYPLALLANMATLLQRNNAGSNQVPENPAVPINVQPCQPQQSSSVPQTSSDSEQAEPDTGPPGMAEYPRQFYNKHNMVVGIDLDAKGIDNYHQILEFLMRSRIFHVLTHSPPLMIDYIRQFWATARYDCEPTPPVIRARVNNADIAFSRVDLRTILQLGTDEEEDGPTEFSADLRAGAFARMGYTGDVTKNQYTKSFLFGQWRYLMHVLIVSLAAKKAGFDVMNAKLQSGMISLVYHKPYSFSQYFFSEFVQQMSAGGRERFLLFPRFVMMIIRHFLPDIPSLAQVRQVSIVDRRMYTDCLGHSSRRAAHERPQQTPLFGYLIDVNYVAPPNDGWLDVPQPNQPEGDVLVQDVGAETQHQSQGQAADPVVHQERQEVLEEVFTQLDQPRAQVADPVYPDVAEVVLEVLQQGFEQDDDVFAEIDAYMGDVQNTGDDVVRDDGDDAQKEGDNAGDKDSEATKSDIDSDDDGDGDYVCTQYGSKLVAVKRSGPPPESSSRGKRKVHDDDDYELEVDEFGLQPSQSKTRRSSTADPTATTSATTTTATTTAIPTAATTTSVPVTTSLPYTTLPTSSVPTDTMPANLKIVELEAQFLVLNAKVESLSSHVMQQAEAFQHLVGQHLLQTSLLETVFKKLAAQGENLG